MTLIFADGSTLDVSQMTFEPHFVVEVPNRDALLAVWDKMTSENLSFIEVVQTGSCIAAYTGCELTGVQAIINPDGSMLGHFYMTGLPQTHIDPDYKDAYEIVTGKKEFAA